MQSYLAWRTVLIWWAMKTGDWKDAGQARFVMTLLTEALAPIIGSRQPRFEAYLQYRGHKRRSRSAQLHGDLFTNGAMPQQVASDRPQHRPFAGRRGLQSLRGHQYSPSTERVFHRPRR